MLDQVMGRVSRGAELADVTGVDPEAGADLEVIRTTAAIVVLNVTEFDPEVIMVWTATSGSWKPLDQLLPLTGLDESCDAFLQQIDLLRLHIGEAGVDLMRRSECGLGCCE
jgi:hypothetical protein